MAFALIRPESRHLIDAARTPDARLVGADRAAVALRADFERWSRWALGLLGFALAIGGAFVTAGMIEAARMLGGSLAGVDLVVIVVAVFIGLGGVTILVALWSTGRRILSAASWWHRLPYTAGGRQRRAGGWLRTRTVNFEPRVFVRLTSATCALLIGVGGVALFLRDLGSSTTSMTAASAAVGVIALVAGLGQAGGVMHLVSGLSEADPLWVRIRSVFVRR